MSVKIEVSKIQASIDVEKEISDFMPEAVSEIQKLAPKDTGEYAKGFTFKVEDNIGYLYNNGIGKSLTHILEFGSKFQKAQPHFRPTYKKMSKKFLEHMKKVKINIKT